MQFAYRDFLSSEPFRVIGPNGKLFFVHAALIARHSKTLKASITGGMKEAEEKKISIKDSDGDITDETVMRFIEYAYTGDYTVPDADQGVIESAGPMANETEVVELTNSAVSVGESSHSTGKAVDSQCRVTNNGYGHHYAEEVFEPVLVNDASIEQPWDYGLTLKERKRKRKAMEAEGFTFNEWGNPVYPEAEPITKEEPTPVEPYYITVEQRKQDLWSDFVSAATIRKTQPWEPKAFEDAERNCYRTDLLCHAQLYIFSSRYVCSGLAELALQKLRLTLSRYDPKDGMKPINDLVGYTYTHTQEYSQAYDKLRALVIDYLVCHLEKVMTDGDFQKLLRESEGLAVELLTSSMKRLQ